MVDRQIVLNINDTEVEFDKPNINNEEELKKLNDEINKRGNIEFSIQD